MLRLSLHNLMKLRMLVANDKLLIVRSLASNLHGGMDSGGGGGRVGKSRGWDGHDGSGSGPLPVSLAWGVSAFAILQLATASPASASNKKDDKHQVVSVDKPDSLTVEGAADLMWQMAGPLLTNLGFSGAMGFAAGYAAKKVGQMVAVIVGLAFAAIQALTYTGAISVNWSHIEGMVQKALDHNKDGKFDKEDFKLMSAKGLSFLSQGVPSVTGFLTGFLLGLRF